MTVTTKEKTMESIDQVHDPAGFILTAADEGGTIETLGVAEAGGGAAG